MAHIAMRELIFAYDSGGEPGAPALQGVNLDIAQGEFIGLLGRNGSGKSTLSKCLNALLAPTGGSVRVGALDTADRSNRIAIRTAVGMVFQNPDNQFVTSRVIDEVAFGPENLGVGLPELSNRVNEALEMVGLADMRDADPERLSAGEKARLAVACVLAMRPECIVFDEATAMLDPQGRAEVLSIAQRENERGVTVVWVTHILDEVVDADRVVVMDQGRVGAQGAPGDILTDRPLCVALGIGLPPAAAIAAGLGDRGLVLAPGIVSQPQLEVALCQAWEARQ